MAVSISGTSSPTWTDGQTRTITGTGFGTKATAAPQIWDTFSGGTNGAAISGNSPTQTTVGMTWGNVSIGGTNEPRYSNARTRGGRSLSALCAFPDGQWNNSLSYSRAQSEYFISWWHRVDKISGPYSRNSKPWVMYGSTDSMEAYAGWGDLTDPGFRTAIIDLPSYADPSTDYGPPGTPDQYGLWTKFELYLKQSTPGVADGAYKLWLTSSQLGGRVLSLNRDPVITRGSSNFWRQLTFIGAYHDGAIGGTRVDNIYGSDLYYDNTLSHVLLGNASTLASCTITELQIPTAWSSTSITVTVNQAGLSNGPVYLFVFDSTGDVNPTGYPVTLGSGGSVIIPVAAFAATPLTGQAPLIVNFDSTSSLNTPESWAWNFGANASPATATTQNPSTTYAYGGAKTVTLTATNSAGSDDEIKTNYITARYLKPTNFGAS